MAFEPLLDFALIIHYQEVLGLLLFLGVGVFVLPRKKIFLVSAVLTFALSLAMKSFFHLPRPCVEAASSLVACPNDFGFPSVHSAMAALIILGSTGEKSFWLLAPAAIFVAYSRIFLGVHSLDQVLAGLALGSTVYLMVWLHVKKT